MKNKLTDLNNHLFAQMERLSEEELDGGKLQNEIDRTEAIVQVSDQIIKNANLHLKAAELAGIVGQPWVKTMTPMLGGPETKEPENITQKIKVVK